MTKKTTFGGMNILTYFFTRNAPNAPLMFMVKQHCLYLIYAFLFDYALLAGTFDQNITGGSTKNKLYTGITVDAIPAPDSLSDPYK